MFCNQCEQTWRSDVASGCNSTKGMCGKDAPTADLQDVLLQVAKGIGWWAAQARALGAADERAGGFITAALFTTLTNVNFNPARFVTLIGEAVQMRDRMRAAAQAAAQAEGKTLTAEPAGAAFNPGATQAEMLANAPACGLRVGVETVGEDVIGLRSMLLFGLKGVCAYAHHAHVLGGERPEVHAGIETALALLAEECADAGLLVEANLALGKVNFSVMEMLDAANTGAFGHPEPTQVRMTAKAGKAILVSGHDMKDLKAILEATKDQGINIYTHGELLPANAYPGLKAYPHLVGNYGGAWQDQQRDFAAFPGPIVMTSNCLIEPQASYRQRIFTAGPVGWPGLRHIADGNFAVVVQAAKALPGFTEDAPERFALAGFARQTVLGAAGTVIDAVKAGAIKHFFLIGGCDGAAPGRNYFTDVAEQAPDDTVLLTLGCGKFRFNDKEFGTIGGLPRLLDVGQCNDAYSAVVVASELAKAFECGVNDLPLTLMVSWFEQKAAAVLLTLLALGVRHIHLGPTLPAFLTPGLLNVLVEKFGIKPVGSAQGDIAAALARAA